MEHRRDVKHQLLNKETKDAVFHTVAVDVAVPSAFAVVDLPSSLLVCDSFSP